ncbi:oxidoreductase [Pseudohongiella acticola]|uniref:Oxidoreductase n=1 Tax=Pseudohongiella acticola TaxID=1524254 RepID=A0A1E8CHY3_9GAMM|nr:Gfo/Idh/MocA family oxidoreductase [Pseudohongiella acticola]OFE12110.1 oxidoreductase [Pseudohongiella acticola]
MKQLKLGMIGGGHGSFIGAVHRRAAMLDGHFQLTCGAFSSDPTISAESGASLGLPAKRVYASYADMFSSEAALPPDQRMQAVAIVTPNHLHAAPAIEAMRHGFHVIVDKPLAISLDEARQIQQVIHSTGCQLALTHTYAGYPMIKEARQLVHAGKLGPIRKVLVEYPQGWLSQALEDSGNRQASWRTDPGRAGAGAIGDIGTHAAHLAEYVSGQLITELCADLNSVVNGRQVDDDAAALLRFSDGASGTLIATQVATGEENNVCIRVYGELGGLQWSHRDAESLRVNLHEQPAQLYRRGDAYLSQAAANNSRLPPGHPEGFIEAFANIYGSFARRLHTSGASLTPADLFESGFDYPSIDEGLRGMAFIEAMQRSAKSTQKWTTIKP